MFSQHDNPFGRIPLLKQLIRRDDDSVVVVDYKGDSVLFNPMRLEALRTGRAFKWFTNQSDG